MEKKFYRCAMCGNLVVMMRDSENRYAATSPWLLTANTVDAPRKICARRHPTGRSTVQVGSVVHPWKSPLHRVDSGEQGAKTQYAPQAW